MTLADAITLMVGLSAAIIAGCTVYVWMKER